MTGSPVARPIKGAATGRAWPVTDSAAQQGGGGAEQVLFDLIQPRSSTALVCPEDQLSLTHEQLASLATELAGRLHSAGVSRGDRIAIVLSNGPEILLCLFAVALLGAVAAPLNYEYTEAEYRFYLTDLAPKLVIAESAPPAALLAAARDLPMVEATAARPSAPPTLLLGGRELRPATS